MDAILPIIIHLRTYKYIDYMVDIHNQHCFSLLSLTPYSIEQLLNDNCMKRKGALDQDTNHEEAKDLRSRGLCLVPIQCTMQVGNETGADYWAPAIGGGFH